MRFPQACHPCRLSAYSALRKLLFALPAEPAHTLGAMALRGLEASAAGRAAVRRSLQCEAPELVVECMGIRFPAPVGIAAGFDKNAQVFNALGALGFGFVEAGTVTACAQLGNPRPRLFRLPEDEALLNRMGFNNHGAEAVAARLAAAAIEPILGINIGKSKAAPLEGAVADYLQSLRLLEPFAAYLAINVSSPNTPGLRELQQEQALRELLREMVGGAAELAAARGGAPRPVLVKLAPDLNEEALEVAVDVAASEGAAGLILANTTVRRDELRTAAEQLAQLGAGGISGRPVHRRAAEMISRAYRQTNGELPIIGAGGVFDAADAWRLIAAGASLVQLYTGFVYGGPGTAHRINRGLLQLLNERGFRSIDEAVGSAGR